MSQLTKVISGGQTGVDQAALRAAQQCGLACGGWCPPGRWCENGIIPVDFPLQETPHERSPAAPHIPRSQRTEWNVRDAEATLILKPKNLSADAGTEWTKECTQLFQKPLLIADPSDAKAVHTIQSWLRTNAIHSLNVAGPSEGTVKGIGEQVYTLLLQVFQ